MIWGVPVFTFHLSVCNIPPPLRSSQRRNGDNLGGHGMPCPYKLMLSSVLCYLYSIHFLPLRQGEYHEVGRGYVKKL